jgi:uncharacterized protein (DUF1697 family)
MTTWIALLRGVNVGGKGVLPMKRLVELLELQGIAGARTYIQSGNIVFRSSRSSAQALSRQIAQAILADRGFEPKVLVLRATEMAKAIADSPFPDCAGDPQRHHLYFLAAEPVKPDLSVLERLKKKNESYALKGAVFYLHTPDGMAESKVAMRVEKVLGVDATARNWNTVTKLLAMATTAE